VYVQVGGESFERRPFIAGPTDGTFTIVAGGVSRGEHVVTRGAYHVYLASLGTTEIGDHGHPH
jgi:membrane fusion protein, heavy metal efflux system